MSRVVDKGEAIAIDRTFRMRAACTFGLGNRHASRGRRGGDIDGRRGSRIARVGDVGARNQGIAQNCAFDYFRRVGDGATGSQRSFEVNIARRLRDGRCAQRNRQRLQFGALDLIRIIDAKAQQRLPVMFTSSFCELVLKMPLRV